MVNTTYTRCRLKDVHYRETLARLENAKVFEKSHRKEAANEVGFLGEVVAESWLKKHNIGYRDDRGLTTHDYVLAKNLTLDVKTKDRTVVPKIHHDNSVPLYNHDHQRPDWYLFISLLRDKTKGDAGIYRFTTAFIVGAINIFSLERVGKVWEAGEVDPDNGTKFWTSCINVRMSDLTPLREVILEWGGLESR